MLVRCSSFTFNKPTPAEKTSAVIHICCMHCGETGPRIAFPISAQRERIGFSMCHTLTWPLVASTERVIGC